MVHHGGNHHSDALEAMGQHVCHSGATPRGGDRAALEATRNAVRQLASKPTFRLTSPDHDHRATMAVWEAHPTLTYHDAAGVAAARRLGTGVLTFDGHQRAAHES